MMDLVDPNSGGLLGDEGREEKEEEKEEKDRDPKQQIWNHTEYFLDDFKDKAFKVRSTCPPLALC